MALPQNELPAPSVRAQRLEQAEPKAWPKPLKTQPRVVGKRNVQPPFSRPRGPSPKSEVKRNVVKVQVQVLPVSELPQTVPD